MAAQGLDMKDVQEILRLKALGFGKRKIARTLGIHRNTVTKYFEQESPAGAVPEPPVNAMVSTDAGAASGSRGGVG
ncbi:MAG: helix-turn-helix domain-containing protein [Calothrix sp. SM1_5_4]|nr:helix-turn-helix domain-containing protein [Calothrix sp. SM1_5_4]